MKKQLAAIIILVITAFLVGRYNGARGHNPRTTARRILDYVDPMHPAYRSNKAGIAPDCGMALEPVYEDEDPAGKLQLAPDAIAISSERQQLIGVNVEAVQRNSGTRVMRTTGRVEADESRVHRVMSGAEGWVQSIENYPAGSLVKQNQLLATLYSKEFRNAEQAYIGSATSLDRLKAGHDPADPRISDANLRINEEQLRALGMGEPQIKELAKTRQVTRDVTVSSPIDGIVLSRSITPGQRFENGTEFYRNCRSQQDLDPGRSVRRRSESAGTGQPCKSQCPWAVEDPVCDRSHNPALFDAASRTLKVRLEADNPGLVLRPDMFVDLELTAPSPAGISVQQDAVMDRGLQKIVYVETSDGIFEPRRVEIGTAYGDRATVTRGLAEGDRVVTAGNFLIDSESRMRSSAPVVASSGQQQSQHSQEQASPNYAKQKMGGTSALHDSRAGND